MAKLVLNPTSPARRDIVLPRSVLSIGRDPSNDLVLPDAMVSRRHALVECRGNQYFLRDCNSSNGSLVNGDRVNERGLRDGDLVAIGTVRLLFREDVAASDPSAKVVQHPSAPRQVCPACQAEHRQADVYCRQCGGRLQESPPRVVCTACGTVVLLPARFCNACGGPVGEAAFAPMPPAGGPRSLDPTRPQPSGVPAAAPDEPAPVPGRKTPDSAAGLQESADAPGAGAAAAHAVAAPAQPPPWPARERRAPGAPLRAVPIGTPRGTPAPDEVTAAQDGLRRRAARPAERLAAALLDGALVCAGLLLLSSPVFVYWRFQAADTAAPAFLAVLGSVVLGVAAPLAAGAYYVYFWGVRGATPGKRLLRLAVEGVDGLYPVGVKRATLRLLGYLLSAGALGLGFVVILFGAPSLHDRLAGTRVMKETDS